MTQHSSPENQLADRLHNYVKECSGDWATASPALSWSNMDMIIGALRRLAQQPASSPVTADHYRKKPVVIRAWRLGSEEARPEWAKWTFGNGHDYAEVQTLEGTMRGNRGDWIIQGVKGELYFCKPDIFAATYEPASAPAQQHPDPYKVGKEWCPICHHDDGAHDPTCIHAQTALPPLVDRAELIALLEDLASVNLSREACVRQARRMADDLIARGVSVTSTDHSPPAPLSSLPSGESDPAVTPDRLGGETVTRPDLTIGAGIPVTGEARIDPPSVTRPESETP